MDARIPHYINLILKPIDDICNLNCNYCHEKYDQKLLPSNGLISSGTYNNLPIIQWFPKLLKELKNIPEIKKVNFCWHGGEPLLLPFEFYNRIVKEQRKQLNDNFFDYENVVITNCMNMDKNKIKWIEKLGFSLSISCDGPTYHHNKERFDSIHKYQIFRKNLNLVNKESKAFSLHMVINKYSLKDYPAFMNFFEEINPINGVALGMCYLKNNILNTKELSDFFCNLFDIWNPKRTPYILLFQEIINGLNYFPPRYCKIAKNGCISFITVDSNGLLYSGCQRKEALKIGNIAEINFTDIIKKHIENIALLNKKIKGKTIYESSNSDPRFIYFQSKGCPNRLDNKDEDPYLPVYVNLMNHISDRLKIDIDLLIKELKERHNVKKTHSLY
ncbi:MAG: radical SAM protein [bacterium]